MSIPEIPVETDRDMWLSVFVRLTDQDQPTGQHHVRSTLTDQIELVDASGAWYAPHAAWPIGVHDADLQRGGPRGAASDWVVLFPVSKDSRGHILRVRHPLPDSAVDVPRSAVVLLEGSPSLAGQPREEFRAR